MPAVLITGGTGLIGKNLTSHLTSRGYEVIIVSRKSLQNSNPLVSYSMWNIEEEKIDKNAIEKADYIIHLAGAGVMDKRWTKKYKQEIIDSRIKSTNLLIKALRDIPNQVKAVISASAIGWYGNDPKPLLHKDGFTETDEADENFLGETCKRWEESLHTVIQLNKRLVIFRFGIVLSNEGGALAEFKKPLQFGIAAILGSGKQVISWIHADDLCRILIYALENEQLSGIYNAVAPLPVTNKKLILKLAKLIRGQFHIAAHVPKFVLKLILGERSIEVLKSTTVNGEKIKDAGFTFLYPNIDGALKELTSKKNQY